MSQCSHCRRALVLPPSILELQRRFPNIIANSDINRSILRCEHCDTVDAHRRAMDVELPPPDYENPITKLEKHIQAAKTLIEEDIMRKELSEILPVIREQWGRMVVERDMGIRKVWEDFWAVWGVLKGQEGM
jgi:hypothetical protein